MVIYDQSQTHVVGTCLTRDQRREVETMARECGVSLSHVVRVAVVRLLELRPEVAGRYIEGGEGSHAVSVK